MIRLVRITKILPVLFAFTMKLASIFWQALGIISAVCSVWSSPLILSALSSFTREGTMAHWRGWFDNASHLEVQLRFPTPEISRYDASFSLQGSQFSNNLSSSLVVSQRTWEFQPNNWANPDGSGCHPSKIKTENNPLSDFQNFTEHSGPRMNVRNRGIELWLKGETQPSQISHQPKSIKPESTLEWAR